MNCNFWNKSNSWNQLYKKITQDLVIDFVFLAQKIINHFANEAILFCKTRNIRRKFTQPFITTKFDGFTLFFGLQISVFKTATIKLALHGTNTHYICVRYIKHTFFLHQKGVCFSSRCCPLKKAIKAKIDLFFFVHRDCRVNKY